MDRRLFWPNRSYIAFDTESTGLDLVNDRPIQVAVAVFLKGQVIWHFNWYSNTSRPSASEALAVHQIQDDWRQANGIHPREIMVQLMGMFNRCIEHNVPVIAFNAPFDFSMIIGEMRRFSLKLNTERLYVIDPLVIDRHYEKNVPIFTKPFMRLGQMAARYGVSAPTHNALDDAICAGYVATAQSIHHSAIRTGSPRELHARQTDWYMDFRGKIRAFAAKKNIEFSTPDWPFGDELNG